MSPPDPPALSSRSLNALGRPGSFVSVLVYAGLPLVACMALMASMPYIVVNDIVKDFMVPLDLGWRVAHGQRPGIDFHNPIGPLFAWLEGLASLLMHGSPKAEMWAQFLIALPLIPILSWISARRLSLLGALFSVLIPTLVVISPRTFDNTARFISWLGGYNRDTWALVWVLVLASCRPATPHRISSIIDTLLLSCCLAALFLIKLPSAAVGTLALLSAPLVGGQARTAWPSIPTGLGIGFLALWSSGTLWPYINDLHTIATAVHAPLFRWPRLIGAVLANAAVLVWILIAWGCVRHYSHHKLGLQCLFVCLAALANANQNNDLWNPLLLLIPLLIWESSAVFAPAAHFTGRQITVLGIVFLVCGHAVLQDTGAIVLESLEASGPTKDRIPYIQNPQSPMHAALIWRPVRTLGSSANGFVHEDGDIAMDPWVTNGTLEPFANANLDPLALNPGEERWVWNHAAVAAAPYVHAHTRIFTIGFMNPMPIALNARNPTGDLTWWDGGRSYSLSPQGHPDPIRILDHSDMVVEFVNLRDDETEPMMRAIFDPLLPVQFRLVHKDAWVKIWVKR